MPLAKINAYLDRIADRQADAQLLAYGPIMAPHMDAGDRQRMVQSWRRLAGADGGIQATDGQLAMAGIGVKHE